MLGERKAESEKYHVVPQEETDARILAGNPQPPDDTQITRNWLN